MKIISHLIIVLLLLQSCRDSNVPAYNLANLHVKLQAGVLVDDNGPFTGIIYSLQPNQKDTAEIVCFNRGKENGTWKKFYQDGRLAERRYFSNGKKVGEFDAWWPNGRKKLVYHFKDGEYNGLCRTWSDKGQLIEAMNYINGYEDGHQEQYYDDGKVKSNYMIINGRRYGLLGTKNCVNVADMIFKK